ncbi:MAG: hypothetical protein ABSA06_11760 [Geobacteraceae bacterium]|jgi:hypothetical protein
MAGKIRQIIDEILNKRAKGNEMLTTIIQSKMLLIGVNPNRYTLQSADDPLIIAKLEKLTKQFNIFPD